MSKTPTPNIPGLGNMAGTMDFVKNLWGGMSIPGVGMPGMVMPTLKVEDINKQIADLKAVESWLNLNMNMLRGTIQALEVQSATISTLQSMGEALSAAVKPRADKAAANKTSTADPVRSPYAFSSAPENASAQPKTAPEGEIPSAQQSSNLKGAVNASTASNATPAIWWNMLQDQFKQAVTTALATEKPEVSQRKSVVTKPDAKAVVKKKPAPRKRKLPDSAEK